MKRLVDVSHNNGVMRWQVTKSRGIAGAYIRSNYGLTTDRQFIVNWNASKSAGLERGNYVYMLASQPTREIAKLSYRLVVQTGLAGEYVPALDLEYNAKPDGALNNPARFKDYKERVLSCLEEIEQLFGQTPRIYTSPSFATKSR